MLDNEAIILSGAERITAHKGYGASFQFDGDYFDERERDDRDRIQHY
jgi:hypothetical protein